MQDYGIGGSVVPLVKIPRRCHALCEVLSCCVGSVGSHMPSLPITKLESPFIDRVGEGWVKNPINHDWQMDTNKRACAPRGPFRQLSNRFPIGRPQVGSPYANWWSLCRLWSYRPVASADSQTPHPESCLESLVVTGWYQLERLVLLVVNRLIGSLRIKVPITFLWSSVVHPWSAA